MMSVTEGRETVESLMSVNLPSVTDKWGGEGGRGSGGTKCSHGTATTKISDSSRRPAAMRPTLTFH